MNRMENAIADTWLEGDPYELYVGRWSRQLAPRFLAWLNIPPSRRWLDVGCGTGALTSAIVASCSPTSVTGVEPSEGFLAKARQQLGHAVSLHAAPANRIPLENDSVDATVSGLVLNFVPDAPEALAEMVRVTVEGGTVAAYVWDYAEKMEMMRVFWDAATELDPNVASLDEGLRFPLCQPAALSRLFAGAGLREVETCAIEVPTPFADFDAYWRPFEGGQGPAPTYLASLSETARGRLREQVRARLSVRPGGPATLVARAWCARGIV